jgi:hypothetical protein
LRKLKLKPELLICFVERVAVMSSFAKEFKLLLIVNYKVATEGKTKRHMVTEARTIKTYARTIAAEETLQRNTKYESE